MGCKYVKEFEFGQAVGKGPVKYVKGYYRGGAVESSAADMKQDKAMIGTAVHKHERALHPGKPLTKLATGGTVKMRNKC